MGNEWAKGLLAAVLLGGLLFPVLGVEAWTQETPRQESFEGLGDALFEKWVFAFELLSLLLLGALIGALYLGAKTRRQGGGAP